MLTILINLALGAALATGLIMLSGWAVVRRRIPIGLAGILAGVGALMLGGLWALFSRGGLKDYMAWPLAFGVVFLLSVGAWRLWLGTAIKQSLIASAVVFGGLAPAMLLVQWLIGELYRATR